MTQALRYFLRTSTLLLLYASAGYGRGQAYATASGPGSYLSVGGGASLFETEYGSQHVGGAFAVADFHPHWHYGLEAEARWLRYNATDGLTQSNYLVGPHINVLQRGKLSLYGKFLAGGSRMVFPFNNGSGTFFTMAAGGGLNLRLSDRLSVRALDFEYQTWSDLGTYTSLHPYGLNVGLTYRIDGFDLYPSRKRRARH